MSPQPPRSADDIAELFRGAIQSGQLGDEERLPTVRQTARDFGIAQATAAKAYKALESEGLVITRTAAGTRVAPGASRAPRVVVESARELVESAIRADIDLDDAVAIVRALWPAQVTDESAEHNTMDHGNDEASRR